MKSLPILLLACCLIACETSKDEEISGSFQFYITGLQESITHNFTQGGRVDEDPDQIKDLTVLIFNNQEEIVYESFYHSYDSIIIPDSISIPPLDGGNYTIVAFTADRWFLESNHTGGGQTHRLASYTYSNGPIYAGYLEFLLEEENQEVKVSMKNISIKVSVKVKEGQSLTDSEYVDTNFYSSLANSYEFGSETFIARNQEWGPYNLYISDWEPTNTLYMMPQTISSLRIRYSNHSSNVERDITLSTPIQMISGDAITFTFDKDAFLSGGGNGVFELEDLDWNDLGEVSIP